MGWHIGMTEEEMKEFAGMSCPVSKAKENEKNGSSASAPITKQEEAPKAEATAKKQLTKAATSQVSSNISNGGTSGNTNTACPLPPSALPPPPPPNVQYIYHLCQQTKWDEAVNNNLPYFPPTYMKDGKFTRASVYKEDIVTVANQYYQETPGKWIVLELDCKLLYSLGIPILAQEAPESTLTKPVKCLQIFGGISTSLGLLVHSVYPLFRKSSNGEFLKLLEPVAPSRIGRTEISAKSLNNQIIIEGTTKPGPAPEQPRPKKGFFGRMKKG